MSDSPAPGTFATALNVALERKQMTLSRLRAQLGMKGHSISLAALSYWRSGRSLPERRSSLEAVPMIELLLELEPGALSRFVPGPSARRLGRVEEFDQLLDYPVKDALMNQRFVGESDVSRLATHLTISIGAYHEVRWTRTRRVVVANRDGVEGFTVFMGTDADEGIGDYRFQAIAGCTIDEPHQLAGNVLSFQLRFPRPLALGESAITEVEVMRSAQAAPDVDLTNDYELVAEQRLEEMLVWVNFDPLAIPPRCWVYFEEAGVKHEWPVDLSGTSSVHYRQRDFGPGGIGIRWEWDDPAEADPGAPGDPG